MIKGRRLLSTRSLHVARAWTIATLLSGVACSYYSDDLLNGLGSSDGGVGSTSQQPNNGGTSSDAGSMASQGGSVPAMPTEMGGTMTGGSPEQPSPNVGGAPEVAGGAPDMISAGAGGEPSIDACPNDPAKLSPGQCGCGIPESCAELKAGLAHRYNFDKPGTQALDSVGGLNGSIVGASASQGKVTFDGTTAAYVDLPNGCISALKDASFEIWLQWGGGSVWQRIFDFGTNDKGEGNQGAGTTYLYLTPSDGWNGNALRASFSANGVGSETTVRTASPLATGAVQHLVVVIDDTHNEMRLYLNGSVAGLTGFTQSLSVLKDVNNWIGRSNFVDAPLKATIDEFRIYKVALTAAQVSASDAFGPSPSFL